MLVYFLYGIHHSKEGEANTSYSILMTSSEAVKGTKWGATTRTIKGALTKRRASGEDKNAILSDEETVP